MVKTDTAGCACAVLAAAVNKHAAIARLRVIIEESMGAMVTDSCFEGEVDRCGSRKRGLVSSISESVKVRCALSAHCCAYFGGLAV